MIWLARYSRSVAVLEKRSSLPEDDFVQPLWYIRSLSPDKDCIDPFGEMATWCRSFILFIFFKGPDRKTANTKRHSIHVL